MISYRFVPISSQKGVLFFETPGRILKTINVLLVNILFSSGHVPVHFGTYLTEISHSVLNGEGFSQEPSKEAESCNQILCLTTMTFACFSFFIPMGGQK